MAENEELDLEELFRRELHRHAEEMDISAPVASRARDDARGRRQSRVAMGVAAACVAAVAVTGFVLSGDDSRPTGRPPVADRTSEEPVDAGGWRTEHWHGLQVSVPEDWSWGAAPIRAGGDLIRCGGPDDSSTPYVGRPISQTDVCSMVKHLDVDAPFVWLGADVEPGTIDLGNGYVRETVEVAGTRLTVASDDGALRRRVIASAGISGLCEAEMSSLPSGRSVTTAVGELREASVCAYTREDGQPYRLVAGSPLPLRDFERLETLLREAPDRPVACKDVPEFVVVAGWYEDSGAWQRHDRVFELVCGVVDLGGGDRVRATEEQVETWRSGVFDVSLFHFIGPQG